MRYLFRNGEKKSRNFTIFEKNYLVDLILSNKDIECKKTDAINNEKKMMLGTKLQ